MKNATLALEFNNLGVVCLDEGDHREAMDLFKGASQLMTHVVSQAEEEAESIILQKALQDPRVRHAYSIYSEYVEDGYADEHIEGGDHEEDYTTTISMMDLSSIGALNDSGGSSKSFICKRAIRLAEELLPSQWTEAVAVCCSVVLYNMALVCHLVAVDSVLESSGQKALNLYEMSFTLLSERTSFQSGSTLIGRLMMYSLNNMASLNFELTQWDLSTECMERLTVLATLMQASGVGRSLHEECQSFLLNAMVLKTPTRAPAA
eukprot:CAMPEP_0119014832 /NCGR_PEP_ID=MMETSP1176-20130426/10412_1 /TAXON_ID=265551 /ORGANISM="Synedropsis recta cf, Strain CCMP1620" /LENGTH=262 /DNA_ID=CAMNT_0006968077 /DNA_START=173 /DNA_END=961 /DNA_ORIENTATION=+